MTKYDDLAAKLEAYPHILEKLKKVWGTEKAPDYLHNLKVMDRMNRQGFPFDVLVAIDELSHLHDGLFPKFKKTRGPWGEVPGTH